MSSLIPSVDSTTYLFPVPVMDVLDERYALDAATVAAAVAAYLAAHPISGATRVVSTQASSGTWTIAHSLGYAPTVDVFLNTGEAVHADVVSSPTQVTVTFATPTAGFAVLI